MQAGPGHLILSILPLFPPLAPLGIIIGGPSRLESGARGPKSCSSPVMPPLPQTGVGDQLSWGTSLMCLPESVGSERQIRQDEGLTEADTR